jgi:hypothetical protein
MDDGAVVGKALNRYSEEILEDPNNAMSADTDWNRPESLRWPK